MAGRRLRAPGVPGAVAGDRRCPGAIGAAGNIKDADVLIPTLATHGMESKDEDALCIKHHRLDEEQISSFCPIPYSEFFKNSARR